MDELIIRSLQSRTTPAEEQRLLGWRAAAAANERRYRELSELWSLSEAARPVAPAENVPDAALLIARAESVPIAAVRQPAGAAPAAVGRHPGTAPARGRRRNKWLRPAGAGALAASLVAVGFGLAALFGGDGGAGPFEESDIVTGAGERTTVILRDGSSIRLGPRSHLRLTRADDGVVARLDGRAFFGVRPDRSRRFTVQTDYGQARVFGTRFEVRSEEDEFRVLVVDGKVQVSAGGKALDVTDGELSRSAAGAPPTASKVTDVYHHLRWMGNTLVFQATPLRRAAVEIERRYGVDVVLEDPALGDLTVTVTFTDAELEDVVLVLCETVGAECFIEEGAVRVMDDPSGGAVRNGNS